MHNHTLHDEIMVEAKDGIVEGVKVIIENCMIEAFSKLEVPFKVGIRIQKTWSKKEKGENPTTLFIWEGEEP